MKRRHRNRTLWSATALTALVALLASAPAWASWAVGAQAATLGESAASFAGATLEPTVQPEAGSKLASADEPVATMTTAAAKTSTPIPKPATTTVKTATSSRSATSSGWRQAYVTWYGPGFYGNTMAGGGILTPTSMVVAHRTLPFGTRIEFSYKGRTCTAVVQDRGPVSTRFEFDLGPGVATTLGFSGVGYVSYRIL